jgi:hypothetical protein
VCVVDVRARALCSVLEATSKPRWVAFGLEKRIMPPGFDATRYVSTWLPKFRAERAFVWCSGAVGWLLSRPAAQLFADELELFLDNLYTKVTDQKWEHSHAPDVISGMVSERGRACAAHHAHTQHTAVVGAGRRARGLAESSRVASGVSAARRRRVARRARHRTRPTALPFCWARAHARTRSAVCTRKD